MKINMKKGISLIALVITILVSLILVSIAIAATGNAIENANITKYIDTLNLVRDSVESYYISNSEFPIEEINVNGKNYYNQKELITLIEGNNATNKETFIYDMRQNEDYSENDENAGEFYIIDFSKLGVEKTDIGNKVRSSLDVFAFSYPSMNIYYLAGVEIKGDVYFSLNKRLTYISGTQQEDQNYSSNAVTTEEFEGITITKSSAKWTNEMNLSIISDNITSVSIKIAGSTIWHKLNSNVNNINSISQFNTQGVLNSNFSADEIYAFSYLSSDLRYMEIRNDNTNSIIKLNLNNYDDKSPQLLSYTVSNNSEMSIVSLNLEDFDSGIREVRYEYLTKFDENKNIINYSQEEKNQEYMLTKAKKVRALGSNKISLKVPNDVNKIRVYVIDNAGNYYGQNEILVKNQADYILIEPTINYFSTNGVNFSLRINGNYNEVEAKITSGNDTSSQVMQKITAFDNIEMSGISNFETIYLTVKVVSYNDNNRIETVKNFKYELLGNYPYVPQGFYYVGGTKDTGFIISDNQNDKNKGESFEIASGLVGNQFVWIPVDVDSSSIQNLKSKWYRTAFETGSNYTKTSLREVLDSTYTETLNFNGITATNDEKKLYNNVLSSIQKYKGFYIGRYEAGDLNATAARTSSSQNTERTVGIKKDLYVYNYVPFGNNMTDFSKGATKLANNMYNTIYVGSNLIFGIQWDETMKFIEKNASNSISWGNYLDSTGDAKTNSGTSNKNYKTGRSKYWVAKNIYDLAGNFSEWTMEAYSTDSRVTRGGNYSVSGGNNAAAVRLPHEPKTANELISFRVCLYFK